MPRTLAGVAEASVVASGKTMLLPTVMLPAVVIPPLLSTRNFCVPPAATPRRVCVPVAGRIHIERALIDAISGRPGGKRSHPTKSVPVRLAGSGNAEPARGVDLPSLNIQIETGTGRSDADSARSYL